MALYTARDLSQKSTQLTVLMSGNKATCRSYGKEPESHTDNMQPLLTLALTSLHSTGCGLRIKECLSEYKNPIVKEIQYLKIGNLNNKLNFLQEKGKSGQHRDEGT